MTLFNFLLQIPTGTPNPSDGEAFDFSSPFDVVMFIVLPIVIVILYILYRKQRKRDKE